MHVQPLVILFQRLSSLCMPALRDLKRKRCELPVPTDQPQKRSGPLLTATRSFISPTTISAKVPSAATSCHRAHTSSADAVCSTLDPLHCSKDTAQLFAENRHMRTVNRLLVRVASRHRAKAAACRRARGERRRRRSFSCISGVNHVRQSWEYLCGVLAYAGRGGGDGWRWAPMHTPKSRRGSRAAIWRRRVISHARPVSLTHVMSAQ